MNLIPWARLDALQVDITPDLRTVLNKSANVAAKAMPKGIKISFDQTNPEAVAWVKSHAAELVTQNVLPDSQTAIRQIMQRAFEQGIAPKDAARMIKQYVGILPKHAAAVENYRQELIAKFTEQGIYGPAQAANEAMRMAGAYAQKLINLRARTIARNETMVSSRAGTNALWSQAVKENLLTENEWEREWLVTDDERTCEICLEMEGARAPLLGGTFTKRDGTVTQYTDTNAHVQDRCVPTLVQKEESKAA